MTPSLIKRGNNKTRIRKATAALNTLRAAAMAFAIALGLLLAPHAPKAEDATTESQQKAQAQKQEFEETLTTLARLLKDKTEQQKTIQTLKQQLRQAKENVTKTELEQQLKEETLTLSDIENQITTLTSGITDEAYKDTKAKEFNLEEELQNLAEPFIKMIKSTTEDARIIDNLKTTLTESTRRQAIAKQALKRIDSLVSIQKGKSSDAKLTAGHLKNQKQQWQKRLEEAINLETTTRKQLKIKEEAVENLNLNNYATDFIRTRGLNLLIAIFSFFATLISLRLFARMASIAFRKSGLKKSFYARLAKISFEFFTLLAALIVTMVVLNHMKDWVLLGIMGLFTLALAWISLKVLPAIIEQTILLLNLGAVQEGERLLIDGVPWQVQNLDHYTDFINPSLDGGHFSLPIRELIGRHSRPAAKDEAWFPTKKGDWIQLDNGQIAKVNSQTPELVQLVELGGARLTFTTQEFLNSSFRNLSTGFRIRHEFGLAYHHQPDAADKIPELLKQFITEGLRKLIPAEELNHVAVDLIRAGSSSLDFEAEADIRGSQAARFEEIEGEIIRLIIMACNEHKLELPFPQLVIHQQPVKGPAI